MTFPLQTQKYWNICGFLNDEEVLKIYDIIDDENHINYHNST